MGEGRRASRRGEVNPYPFLTSLLLMEEGSGVNLRSIGSSGIGHQENTRWQDEVEGDGIGVLFPVQAQ